MQVLSYDETDVDQYLFLLMSHVVEPYLAQHKGPVGVVYFPPSQAALACVNNGVAERFEVYYGGVELAIPQADTHLLAAMQHGLPASSGVALGVDRLIALALGHASIQASLVFDVLRA